jgi:type IV secretion system protein VirB4
MFRLDKVIKPWKESASLNDHINMYGFWNETTFLTKSGDVGTLGSPTAHWASTLKRFPL